MGRLFGSPGVPLPTESWDGLNSGRRAQVELRCGFLKTTSLAFSSRFSSILLPLLVLLLSACLPVDARTGFAGRRGSRRFAARQGPARRLMSEEEWLAEGGKELLQRRPAGDEWCRGLPDGRHADALASAPCTGYFECRGGMLAGLFLCPPGEEYSTALEACVEPPRSSCAEHGAQRRSALRMAQSKVGGFNYQAVADQLEQATALLRFKASVIDFKGALSSWTAPRNGSARSSLELTTTGMQSPGGARGRQKTASLEAQAGVPRRATKAASAEPLQQCSGAPCAGGKSCWRYVGCSRDGRVVALTIPHSNLTTPIGRTSIPQEISKLTGLSRLVLVGDPNAPLFGLTGPIPKELSALTGLTRLDLGYNHFTGNLDQSGIPSLTNLVSLRAPQNWLMGPLPSWLALLTALVELDLGRNAISGGIPPGLGSLRRVQTLRLTRNNITGPLPPELGNATALVTLELNKNNLMGNLPDSLTKLSKLETLNLAQNQLSGTVPGFSSLASLGVLDLSYNRLSGPLPLSTVCQSSMDTLSLSGNEFTGGIEPQAFAGCQGESLSQFDASSNRLTGKLSEALFTNTPNLAYVVFANNLLQGTLPASLFNLQYVSSGTIDLSRNQLSGAIPGKAGCVANLYLSYNRLTGEVPRGVLDCSVLDQLDISGNEFTGIKAISSARRLASATLAFGSNNMSGPFPALPRGGLALSLVTLNASGNSFSGPLPDLSKFTTLAQLDLSGNRFSGALVAKQVPTRSLLALNLSRNELTGPLPAELSHASLLKSLELSQNQLSGSFPAGLSSLQQLQSLDVSANSLDGPLPPDVGNMSTLASLDVSGNMLSGPIPPEVAPPRLPVIESMDLSSNRFSGSIPYGFNDLRSGVQLNLSHNELSGAVPPNLIAQFPNGSAFEGNSGLCDGPGLPACPSSGLSTGAIVAVVLCSVVLLGLCLVVLWWALFWRNRKNIWEGGTMLVFEKLDAPLTIQNVLESTNHFDDECMLGRGGFGSVYRATLADGRTVAIKRLAAGSGQGQKEFQAEMQTLGNIRHRNLVVLVAAYVTRPPSTEKLLIYEFLPGGSMDRVLAKDLAKDSPFRRWGVRLKVIEDVARGLKYLHHDCTPRIVHRDMKPANVLLDDQCAAKLADFGLAREFDATKSHVSTSVFGTIGYLAPEYTTRGRLSFKSDVFAFGVMVLQVVTGKQPTDADVAERGLSRWVGGGAVLSVCDPKIEDAEQSVDEIMGIITLGLRCTSRVPSDRPSMEEVVYSLDHLHDFAQGLGKGKLQA